MKRGQVRALAVLLVLIGLPGCGARLYPVEGQLVWEDGQPATELEGSMVCFESAEHRTLSRAMVQPDGRFQLTTRKPGGDGVPPGPHRVYVVEKLPYVGKGETARPLPRRMDPRFGKLETSGLEVTVPLSSSPLLLKVERRRPR
jgi:hypothetical protein